MAALELLLYDGDFLLCSTAGANCSGAENEYILYEGTSSLSCCCPTVCPCGANIPTTLTATFEIVGTDGSGCECIDGATITLTKETLESTICDDAGVDFSTLQPSWSGSTTVCGQVVCLCLRVCDPDTDKMRLLISIDAFGCNTSLEEATVNEATKTCDPLYVEMSFTEAIIQALCFDLSDHRTLKVTITP